MRYEVRWSNGYWKAFDTQYYTSAGLFGLKSEADAAVVKMNKE